MDEIPPLPLLERLDALVRSDACDVVLISRLNLLFGVPVRTWGHDYQIILFKNPYLNASKGALFEHGSIHPDARVLRLPATKDLSLWHFSSYDVAAYLNTNNRYSTIAARMIFDRRIHPVSSWSNSPDFLKRIIKHMDGRLQATPHLTAVRLFLAPMMRFFWLFTNRRLGRNNNPEKVCYETTDDSRNDL